MLRATSPASAKVVLLRTALCAVMAVLSVLPSASVQAQIVAIDYSAYNALLREHVKDGLVDYDAFANAPEFNEWLLRMESVDPLSIFGDERVAYWINLYNAWTIQLINLHNERKSIRNINKTFWLFRLKGPWTEPIVRTQGRLLSLDEVQFGKIRSETSDPRVHFALSCGAMSCAPLRSEAYTGEKLDAQLHDQGAVFLSPARSYNRFVTAEWTFHQNAVFRYYASDFGGNRKELGQFLAIWYNDTTPVATGRRFRMAQGRPSGDTLASDRPPTDSLVEEVSNTTFTSQLRLLQNGSFQRVDIPFDWSLNILVRK